MNNVIVWILLFFQHPCLRAASHSTLLFSSSTVKLSLVVSYAILHSNLYLAAAFLSL
jgi:hypothetical protein